ncbi:hypothetical protein Tco_0952608 [Tanacetum coccineum]|uniref:Uncharacterized protein n=1 Tax=Tanacetum coccineum TaxID=301880 RepID=A0ABQ5DZC6_9ASTR
MILNIDQLEKQLDKEDFHENGSMASFRVLETQFQKFIKLRISLNDEDGIMARNANAEKEGKVDTSKALDASLVDTESNIRPIYGEELMTEVLQSLRNQSVVRQPTAFKSERPRVSKTRFASQVDVNNDFSKPVTTHYLPKKRESDVVKPHHVIASSESTSSSKIMPRFSSNDMVHNHYLDEARKKTQEKGRNSEPSVMPSARLQSTANGSKPKPRINNQKYRNWHASKTSYVTTKTVPIAEHSRNSRYFSDSKHFVPSNKTTNKNKPVEQISIAKKPKRQIPIGHRFSIKKTSIVHEKTTSPRSCLRWKQTGRIFKSVGLKWVPTGKIFESSTTTVDSEPPHGSNTDITNLHECIQTLNSSTSTSINVQEEQYLDLSAGTPFNLKKERIKAWTNENVISGRPRLHGIALIQEISTRQKSQGIRSLLTS